MREREREREREHATAVDATIPMCTLYKQKPIETMCVNTIAVLVIAKLTATNASMLMLG